MIVKGMWLPARARTWTNRETGEVRTWQEAMFVTGRDAIALSLPEAYTQEKGEVEVEVSFYVKNGQLRMNLVHS